MPVVPPGNKQVGEYTSVATMSSNGNTVSIQEIITYGIVLDQTATVSVTATDSVMFGEYTSVIAVGAIGNTINVGELTTYAIVRYEPPTSYTIEELTTYGIVKDNVSYSTSMPINAQIGEYSLVATMSSVTAIQIQDLVAYAIVTEVKPRDAVIVFSN